MLRIAFDAVRWTQSGCTQIIQQILDKVVPGMTVGQAIQNKKTGVGTQIMIFMGEVNVNKTGRGRGSSIMYESFLRLCAPVAHVFKSPEFRTSQFCCICKQRMLAKDEYYKFPFCLNLECPVSFVFRDNNSPINQFQAVVYHLDNKDSLFSNREKLPSAETDKQFLRRRFNVRVDLPTAGEPSAVPG